MSTLAQARDAIAAALSTVDGVTVSPRPLVTPAGLREGEGWVMVSPDDGIRQAPQRGWCLVTLDAVVVVGNGADDAAANATFDEWVLPLFLAVSLGDQEVAGVTARAAQALAGTGNSPVPCVLVQVTVEVEMG